MSTHECKIIQASTKNMLFRKCAECNERVMGAIVNPFVAGRETFYCKRCKKIINKYKATYRLQLVAMDVLTNKLYTFSAYECVQEFLGCSATQLLERFRRDPHILKNLENHLVGMYCIVALAPLKKESSELKAKSLQLSYKNDNITLIDMVQQVTKKELVFDPSVLDAISTA